MLEWWSQSNAGLIGGIGGSVIGLLGALFGTVGGCLAPRGKAKPFVVGGMLLVAALGTVTLIAGIVAVAMAQPYHVWYPLLLGGGLTAGLFGGLTPVILARYRQAEARRMESEQLRSG